MNSVDPNAIKYLVKAKINADGVVDKPDVVGAIFGQTEGLLGDDLDLRDLQKSGRIGRIEVEIASKGGKSEGLLTMSSSLDQVETAIIAAALETIDRVGPCKANIKVLTIIDVRVTKREMIVERAKELLTDLVEQARGTGADLTNNVRSSVQVDEITTFGKERCPAGPNVKNSEAIIIVEGRSDVLNLLRAGIKNAVAVEGTSIPKSIQELSHERVTTAFVDGDRGGELILRELFQTSDIDFVARAPRSQEVEELTAKALVKCLRNKIPGDQYMQMNGLHFEETELSDDAESAIKEPEVHETEKNHSFDDDDEHRRDRRERRDRERRQRDYEDEDSDSERRNRRERRDRERRQRDYEDEDSDSERRNRRERRERERRQRDYEDEEESRRDRHGRRDRDRFDSDSADRFRKKRENREVEVEVEVEDDYEEPVVAPVVDVPEEIPSENVETVEVPEAPAEIEVPAEADLVEEPETMVEEPETMVEEPVEEPEIAVEEPVEEPEVQPVEEPEMTVEEPVEEPAAEPEPTIESAPVVEEEKPRRVLNPSRRDKAKKPSSKILTPHQEALRNVLLDIIGTHNAVLLDGDCNEIGKIQVKELADYITGPEAPAEIAAVASDGVVGQRLVDVATSKNIPVLVGKKKGKITKLPPEITIWVKDDLD